MKAVVNWIEFLLIAHTDRWENEATSYEVIDQQLQQQKKSVKKRMRVGSSEQLSVFRLVPQANPSRFSQHH